MIYKDLDRRCLLPRVAILLAAYNGARWIEEQINSIATQQDVMVKIFISVDVSDDDTLALCQRMAAQRMSLVVMFFNERFGGAARNFFKLISTVDFSDFDYVGFADQDDIWLPRKLTRAHEVLSITRSSAYSSNVTAFWPDGRQVLVKKSQQQVRWDFLFEAAGPGCTYLMKTELACKFQELIKRRWTEVQSVGLHDWFVYAFARTNGYRWVIDEVPGMLYRQHENNQVGVNKGLKALFYRVNKVFSGWGLTQSALIAELVGLGNDPFIKRWSGGGRLGLLWLACHSWQCRRRLRDKLLFALSCVALCFAGNRPS